MVKNLPTNAGDRDLIPGWEDALEEEMATHSKILRVESHGQRNLLGCCPWGGKELDTIEHACMHAVSIKLG